MKLFTLSALSAGVSAHSWIACTDYLEKNARYYDHDLCRAWPRDAHQYAPIGQTFGGDRGFDHRPNSGSSPCKSSRNNNNYQSGHHSTVYYQGQQVILAHPMKNHGTGPCTNPYIPDNGNWIYATAQTNPGQADQVLSVFKQNEVANLGKSPTGNGVDTEAYPKVGYANAPAFCEDTDKSLGTYSFNIPEDYPVGSYTFSWVWAFNHATDYYSTCFEVEIVADKAARDSIILGRGQTDTRAICDASGTSTGENGSTVGCDGSGPTDAPTTTTTEETSTGGGGNNHGTGDAEIRTNQMTGNIILQPAQGGTTRREIHVVFFGECSDDAVPNFWYADFTGTTNGDGSLLRKRRSDGSGMSEKHFVLVQTEAEDIQRAKIGFHWGFSNDGCELLEMPAVVHVIDS
ncbi:Oidioi.mRNA.OKI2018_I69.PAR.g10898.t1.cds [Oikopleura dioica]|uniref:Oidioi.mRNA.OKI2018_I69.PAR.g10898.t1.cds n=1 Tax=Oikopleura dioica TaxID=34765 RepID=A0ABN7RSX0_OIKDI|nr:Oidioi.mRNA.OKI2018_I69.PAR.g10898.t1.cds [Oikopleura dioica]